MAAPEILRNLTWAITTLFEIILFSCILRRRVYRSHPVFALYGLVVILQEASAAFAVRYFNPHSIEYFNFAWSVQAVVVCIRWLAVTEIARRVLAGYSGIWKMASHILVLASAIILAYSIAVSGARWDRLITSADRAVELCIGAFIVGMLLFARYYRLAIANLERQLATGFCLFSCFWVINNSIYQHWGSSAATLWEVLSIFSFFATLLIWISAIRNATAPQQVSYPVPISVQMYGELSKELDSRLQVLNRRLSHLLHSQDSRS